MTGVFLGGSEIESLTAKSIPALLLQLAAMSLFACSAAHAHVPLPPEQPNAQIDIWLSNDRSAQFDAYLNFDPVDMGSFANAMARAVGCPNVEIHSGTWYGSGWVHLRCPKAQSAADAQRTWTADLRGLKDALRDYGVTYARIGLEHAPANLSVVTPNLNHEHSKPEEDFGSLTVASLPSTLSVRYGYPEGLPAQILLLALGVVVVPGLLVYLLGRGLVRRAQAGEVGVHWFGQMRLFNGAVILVVLSWTAATLYWGTQNIIPFVAGVDTWGHLGWTILRNSTWLGVPALSAIAVTAGFYPVSRHVLGREWSFAETLGQSVWLAVFMAVPAALLFTAMEFVGQDRIVDSVLLMAVAIVVALVCLNRVQATQGIQPEAITHGVFRERVFALARDAGVELKGLYLLPNDKSRLANAMAATGRNVYISERLMENLSKPEMDAIVAHELAHLKAKHPARLLWLPLVIATPLLLALILGGRAIGLPEWSHFPIGVVVVMLSMTALLRRFERTADKGAVAVTHNPEAFITGMAKVTALNKLPLDWDKASGRLLTHPSTRERIDSIAKQAGIELERVEAILAQAGAEQIEPYSIEREVAAPERLFTTQARGACALRMLAGSMAICAVVPAITAALGMRTGWDGGAIWTWIAVGSVATAATLMLSDKWEILAGLGGLSRRLRVQLERQFPGLLTADSIPVGLSPVAEFRHYDGAAYWDAGFLTLTRDALIYTGEQVRFRVSREQVASISYVDHLPGWWPDRVAFVRTDDGEVFYVGRMAPEKFALLWRRPTALEVAVRGWEQGDGVQATQAMEALSRAALPDAAGFDAPNPAHIGIWLISTAVAAFAGLSVGWLLGWPLAELPAPGTAVLMMAISGKWLKFAIDAISGRRYRELGRAAGPAAALPPAEL